MSTPQSTRIKIGDTHTHKGVTLEVVEVTKLTTFSGITQLMIAYKIRDRDYVSPVAHVFVNEGQDVRTAFEQVIDYYLNVKRMLLRGSGSQQT